MVEMMERIKKGNVQLRRVDVDPPKSGAGSGGVMAEMASLLVSTDNCPPLHVVQCVGLDTVSVCHVRLVTSHLCDHVHV